MPVDIRYLRVLLPSLALLLPLAGCAADSAATAESDAAAGSEVAAAATPEWPAELEAVTAAPESHRVLLENEHVRVLEVVVRAGEKEPVHTHPWPSVMLVDRAARIRYFAENGELAFESPERAEGETAEVANPTPAWLEPEGPHAVENIDTVPFHAIRVELKSPE